MTQASIQDSIKDLLGSLEESTDREILLPVIESLLQESNFTETANTQAYRQLIIDISTALLDSDKLSVEGKKQFEWIRKLASQGHDVTALQALVKRLKPEALLMASTVAQQQPAKAPGNTVAATQSKEMVAESVQPPHEDQSGINFHQMAGIIKEENFAEPKSPVYPAAEENHFNSEELKSLKQTLQTRLESTKDQCNEFENLMQLLLTDIRDAQNPAELENTRNMLKAAVQRLLGEHATISSNIMDVASELNHFEAHCEQLNHELGLVKRLSLTDELTRLPNRRAFLKRLQNESGRVQRYGYPLSVAILDLDLFKEINDTYGHAIGDEVLQTYTKNVLSTFRNYDLVARYGGEEFAVLLPHTDIYGAERALNKVLQKTAETSLQTSDENASIQLPSFSAGVAVYKEGEPIESVINRADKAMYSAKKMGRNRVVVEAVD